MIDLVEPVLGVLVVAVGELDPGEEARRDAPELVGLEPQLADVPGVDREAAVRRVRALDHRERRVDVVDVDVERHELVDDLRVVWPAASAQSSAKLSMIRSSSHAVPGMLPTLMWWAGRPRPRRRAARASRRPRAPLVAGVEEPVGQELDLEVFEAVVVEDCLISSSVGVSSRCSMSACHRPSP